MEKKNGITPKGTTIKTVRVTCAEKKVQKNGEEKKYQSKQGALTQKKCLKGKHIVKSRGHSRSNTNARGGGAEGGGGTSGFAP